MLKTNPEFSLGVIGKYAASRDPEILRTIYNHYRNRLVTNPMPYSHVVKSMLALLSRLSPDVGAANPEGFVESRFVTQLESTSFFDEMNRRYGKSTP